MCPIIPRTKLWQTTCGGRDTLRLQSAPNTVPKHCAALGHPQKRYLYTILSKSAYMQEATLALRLLVSFSFPRFFPRSNLVLFFSFPFPLFLSSFFLPRLFCHFPFFAFPLPFLFRSLSFPLPFFFFFIVLYSSFRPVVFTQNVLLHLHKYKFVPFFHRDRPLKALGVFELSEDNEFRQRLIRWVTRP